MKFLPTCLAFALSPLLLCVGEAWADVAITLEEPREYELPTGFDSQGALVVGQGSSTFLVKNTGDGNGVRCVIVRADSDGARAFTYRINDEATACMDFGLHPDDGFFVRTWDPTAIEGAITGNTSWIDAQGVERWRIPDRRLVEAEASPGGTGVFNGEYFSPIGPILYSPESDRVLAATLGKLSIGFDNKFIAQHHVVNRETGSLARTGFTLGQTGVGIPVAGAVREDGRFLIAQDTLGLEGPIFFTYDGRQGVERFEPIGDSWAGRTLVKLGHLSRTNVLLWTELNSDDAPAHIAATNDRGATIFRAEFETTYRFADGEFVFLGRPLNMWLTDEYTIIAYSWDGEVFLRFIDQNGESPGMARLSGFTPLSPLAVVTDGKGEVRLVTANSARRVIEYKLRFEDVDDYDPNKILEDMDIPDITIGDVLDEAGCGCGAANSTLPGSLVLIFLVVFSVPIIRRVGL